MSVAYVMGCQALSGIAKDLTKMSAKSAVKVLVPKGDDSGLFKWVAVLTGSKNALKGAGFFVGGFLLSVLGFRGALAAMATRRADRAPAGPGLAAGGDRAGEEEGRVHGHPLQFAGHQPPVAGAARIVRCARRVVRRQRPDLPGERAWLVASRRSAAFMALWVIAYGAVQSASPVLLAKTTGGKAPGPSAREHARPRPRCGDRPDPDRTSSWRAAGIDDARRTRALRSRVRAQFVRALVSGARVFRSRIACR